MAQVCVALSMESGRQWQQRCYFNRIGSRGCRILKETLTFEMDQVQRKEVVKNALSWLVVEGEERHFKTKVEFMEISITRYFMPLIIFSRFYSQFRSLCSFMTF